MSTNEKLQHEVQVKAYFSQKAAHYDATDGQTYWQFSDEILWRMMVKLVLEPLRTREIRLLDAGGGTGRWTKRVLDYLPQSKAVLVDISPEMLEVAQEKFKALGLTDRVTILEGDVHSLSQFENDSFDIVLCLHNVLSFVFDPGTVFSELHRVARIGAPILSVMANRYHAYYFSIATGQIDEARRVRFENKVRFGSTCPDMHVFTPSILRELTRLAGASSTDVYGFPVTVYPSIEETTLFGNSDSVKKTFGEGSMFDKIIDFELDACMHSEAASRGNMLLSISCR
jgi:ubiquinone/menaquinone biosynthesis C-methylase UbiE